jgi:hypothetical protein
MATRTPSWRVRLAVFVAAGLALAVVFGIGGVSPASAGYPCNTHYAAPATCVIKGTLHVDCSGAVLRYSLSTSSAIHGYPPVGGYYRYTGLTVGQYVNGSSYCLGISSSYWILTDSGWISRTIAHITS